MASWSKLVKAGREDLRAGDTASAERNFTDAYGLTLGFRKGDPRTDTTVKNLQRIAAAYGKAGNMGGLERVMSLLAQVSEDVPRSRSPELAALFRSYAEALAVQGRHAEARVEFERALAIIGDRNRDDDPDLVGLHAQLGITYLEVGEVELAEYHIQLALGIAQTAEGTDGPLYAHALVGKARLEERSGNLEQAEIDLREALRIAENYYGENHPTTAALAHELATFYRKDGRQAEARAQYERVIAIWDGMPGERFQQALGRNALAWFLLETGRPEDALPLAREALELLEAQGVTGQPLASVSDTLATALRDLKRYDEAEPLYERALTEGAADNSQPGWNVAGISQHYAALLEATGRSDEAEKLVGSLTAMPTGKDAVAPEAPATQ